MSETEEPPLEPGAMRTTSPASPGEADAQRLVANQGAVINQQIVVQGDARFESPVIAGPASSGPARDPATGELTPAELASYREAVRARYGVNHFIGFTSPIEYGMTWEELYVELDMVKAHGHSKHEVFAGLEGEGEGEREKKKVGLDDAFRYASRCKKGAMVMLGDPGSGKTTQLQQMLLRVLDEARGPESLGLPAGTVPVFVAIRDLRLPEGGTVPKLEELVREALPEVMGGVSPELVARLLEHESVLYLLDGLDEVPDAIERARMAKVISSAQRRLGKHHLMVSSRYAGYADVKTVHLGNAFLELRLEPLDDAQVKRLVHNWHQAVEAMDAQEQERVGSPAVAEQHAEALLGRLRAEAFAGQERLGQLARTPLLLTALCLIHRERASAGGLPSDRGEIYGTCEEILLEHWQREVKGRELLEGRWEGFDAEVARRVLQPVAYWLHREDERRYATVADLRGSVEEGLRAVELHDVPAEGFVRSFASESGLLTPYGPELHGFIHLGFQEHLAALHVRERWEPEPEVLADLVGRRGEGWWREVSRMVLEKAEPGLLEAFIERVARGSELEVWSRWRAVQAGLRTSGASVGLLEAVLREAVGVVGEERQLAALRLLVQQVLPCVPAAVTERMDGWLREHPVEAVRRRWLTRAQHIVAGEPRVVEKAGVVLMPIPGGWFSMGSAEDDEQGDDRERPQHEVELSSFWLARTPVTNAQYRRFLKANPGANKPEHWDDPSYNQDEQPVVGVSWTEAQAYCTWAGMVLPTEAQWEYASRAGTTTRYYSGDSEEDLARVGWYADNSGELHPVGELQPNGFGLHDMHGNVWEWCEDGYGGYATKPRPKEGIRHEPVGDAYRVGRGGSFGLSARYARSACRLRWQPVNRDYWLGFRPAQGHPC